MPPTVLCPSPSVDRDRNRLREHDLRFRGMLSRVSLHRDRHGCGLAPFTASVVKQPITRYAGSCCISDFTTRFRGHTRGYLPPSLRYSSRPRSDGRREHWVTQYSRMFGRPGTCADDTRRRSDDLGTCADDTGRRSDATVPLSRIVGIVVIHRKRRPLTMLKCSTRFYKDRCDESSHASQKSLSEGKKLSNSSRRNPTMKIKNLENFRPR